MAGVLTTTLIIFRRYLICLEDHKDNPDYLRVVDYVQNEILKFASDLEGGKVLATELISFKNILINHLKYNKKMKGKHDPRMSQDVDRAWSKLLRHIADVEKDHVEQCPERDIMRQLSEFKNRKTVQIVAPGFLGKDHYKELDSGAFTIVVNKAIELDIRKDVWIVLDWKQGKECAWFTDNITEYAGIACIPAGEFSEAYPEARWVFGVGPLERPEEKWLEPIEGFLRYDTTVTGCALQLAYWLGAKNIILCGVDFQGDKYYDGKGRGVASSHLPAIVAPKMNRLIAWMTARGVKIVSLSKTSLRVPYPGGHSQSLLELTKNL